MIPVRGDREQQREPFERSEIAIGLPLSRRAAALLEKIPDVDRK